MASRQEVPIGRLLTCVIKGVELSTLVRKISIRESICCSYLSGEITILDHNQFINNIQIIGLDPVELAFDAPMTDSNAVGDIYEAQMYVLSINGQASPENVRSIIYTISVVSGEYFTDRGNIVTESTTAGTTGVALSQKIWGECAFPTALTTPVTDSPLQDGNQPFHIDMQHPFTAIAQIRDAMNFPQYPTGNVLLYRDRYVENLVPLQYLFDTLAPQGVFEQRATWGVSYRDMFDASNMVIEAKQQTRGSGTTGMGGGGGGAQDVAATGVQGIKKYDMFTGKLINNMAMGTPVASIAGSVTSMISGQFSAYGLGGSPNMMSMNSDNRKQQTDFTAKTVQERSYAALVKAGPQYNIVVPLRTGISCTVGKGAIFNLLPATTQEQWKTDFDAMPITALITDLIHDVYNDMKLLRGTTTLQVMQGTLGG